MLVTIGIPVYNAEKYVREAIQSVLDQTFTDYELILTDDGSTDGSLDIIRSFCDPRIRVVADGAHKGLAIRLNEQIANAKGLYFARMDADDVMLPQRIERQIAFVKQHPETDVVGSSTIVIDEYGNQIGWRGAEWKRGEDRRKGDLKYKDVRSFMHPTVMGRTEWFRRYYYNPACEGCEDLDLWARSVYASSFYVLYEPLMLYRDPQKLNLDTYLFRNRQGRYVKRINRERIPLLWYLHDSILSYCKSALAWLLAKTGQDQKMLRLRNNTMSPLNNHVMHVITSLRTGGAEKLMVDLLPRLRNKELEVELVVFDGIRTPFLEALESKGLKIHIFSENISVYNPIHIIRLWKLMRQVDVVHTHNTAPQLFAAIANLFVRTTLLTTEHSTSNRRRNHRWMKPLDCWLYHQFKAIVAVSNVAGQNIKEYVGNANLPVRIIPNGIDVEKFLNASSCEELDLNYKGVFKSVMVAGFRYEKDQMTIIRSFAKLPEKYHLFLVGDGEKRRTIEQLILSLKLQRRVHLLGIRMDVPNILHSADNVIMSSHREGLSLSNLEGMASGKPFIASDVDGLHEIVDGYGILVPHEDPQALADAIRRVSEDREYAKQVADRCVERARMFDISVMAEKYSRLY